MNENQINGSEFSGAAASSTLRAVATAVAQAVVSGSRTVYRSFSATITSSQNVTGVLRNQYNGLIILAAVVIADSQMAATFLRIRHVASNLAASYNITALIKRIFSVQSAVSYTVNITARLRNQFNGVLQYSTTVTHQTVINANAFRVRLSAAAVSQAYDMFGRLSGLVRIASTVTMSYTVTASAYCIKRARSIVSYSTNAVGNLAAVARVRTLITPVVDVLARLKKNSAGSTVITQSTNVEAELTTSRYAPASLENTFIVPPDDVTYEVEES